MINRERSQIILKIKCNLCTRKKNNKFGILKKGLIFQIVNSSPIFYSFIMNLTKSLYHYIYLNIFLLILFHRVDAFDMDTVTLYIFNPNSRTDQSLPKWSYKNDAEIVGNKLITNLIAVSNLYNMYVLTF